MKNEPQRECRCECGCRRSFPPAIAKGAIKKGVCWWCRKGIHLGREGKDKKA